MALRIVLWIIVGCLLWIVITTSIMLSLLFSDLLYKDKSFTWEQETALRYYVHTTTHELDLEICVFSVTPRQWKTKVNNAVGYHTYIELRKLPPLTQSFVGDVGGWSLGAFANTVYVSECQYGIDYPRMLLHELVHLTRFTFNESKTNFHAFRLAYESPNPYMNRVAMELAIDSFTNYRAGDKYKATGRIIHYLEGRGVI